MQEQTKKTYILKKDCPNIGKEIGDYYMGEYGDDGDDIEDLIKKGIIEEELDEEPTLKITKRELKILVMALSALAGANHKNDLIVEITDLIIKVLNAK